MDWVISECLDVVDVDILEIRSGGWRTAKSPRLSGTRSVLSSDQFPGAKGSGRKPATRAWVSVWLRKQMKQKTADSRKTLARETSGFIISSKQKQNIKIAVSLLPWGTRLRSVGGRAHGVDLLESERRAWGLGSGGVCILHASGFAAVFISHFEEYKSQPPWVKEIITELRKSHFMCTKTASCEGPEAEFQHKTISRPKRNWISTKWTEEPGC